MRIVNRNWCNLFTVTAALVVFAGVAAAQSTSCSGTGYFGPFNSTSVNVDKYTGSLGATLDANADGVGAGTLTCTANVVAGQGQHYLWLRYQEFWFETTGPVCIAAPCADTLVATLTGPGLVSDTTTLSGNGTTAPPADSGPMWVVVGTSGSGNLWGRTVTRTIDVSSATMTADATFQFQLAQTFPPPGAEGTAVYGTFTVGRSVQLLDPVLELISNNEIVQDPETLGTLGTSVIGVAADGASQVVVKIRAQNPGQIVTLNVFNDNNRQSNNPAQDGTVSVVNGSPSSSATLTAANTNEGPMAFAIYHPPTDFSRGTTSDNAAVSRYVTLQWTLGSGVGSSLPAITESAQMTIVRPPVIMIHGLWSSSQAWLNFTPFYGDGRFAQALADYSIPTAGGISATDPNYPWFIPMSSITTSALGFSYNAPTVLVEIEEALVTFRSGQAVGMTQGAVAWPGGVAATQVDAVAHSMGGNIVRTLEYLPLYSGPESFGRGNVHKLITIGTPHLGTPLATQLLAANNSCIRDILAYKGNISLNAATVAGVTSNNGAVGNLIGSGLSATDGTLSIALREIQPSLSNEVPTAMIAGATQSQNLNSLGQPINLQNVPASISTILGGACGGPLGTALTPTGWNSLFVDANNNAVANDAIVPVPSQWNAMSGPETLGVIHTSAIEPLNFTGPDELAFGSIQSCPTNLTGSGSSIQTYLVCLLNASVSGNSFTLLP